MATGGERSELLEFVIDCENYLGLSYGDKPRWKGRRDEIGKLKRVMVKDRKVTLAHLRLALAYSIRTRSPITSAAALAFRIDDALKVAEEVQVVTDLDVAIREAIAWEYERDDDDTEDWLYQLVRSTGEVRAEVLKDWIAAGRGRTT